MSCVLLVSTASAFTSSSLFTPKALLVPSRITKSVIYSATSGDADVKTSQEGDDGDFHPSDSAVTTPEFLAGLWQLIARGNDMVRGVSALLLMKEIK